MVSSYRRQKKRFMLKTIQMGAHYFSASIAIKHKLCNMEFSQVEGAIILHALSMKIFRYLRECSFLEHTILYLRY
jgi:hypothetical protein